MANKDLMTILLAAVVKHKQRWHGDFLSYKNMVKESLSLIFTASGYLEATKSLSAYHRLKVKMAKTDYELKAVGHGYRDTMDVMGSIWRRF